MSRAKKVIQSIEEKGLQYRTQVKNVPTQGGSRHIRNSCEKAKLRVEQMLNPKHNSPNPADDDSKGKLEVCRDKLAEVASLLKEVKDSKRKPKW